jgi:two-component system LytT family response regulator
MPIRVLIVDDEPTPRARVRRLLRDEPDAEVVGECEDGRAAVEQLRQLRPDVVFLDVSMPELDGFAVLDELPPALRPLVVFVTAYDEYALRAFDVHAVDYLLKPFERDRFRAAFSRLRERLAARRSSGAAPSPDAPVTPDGAGRALAALLEEVRAERRAIGELVERVQGAPGVTPQYADRVPVRTDGRITFVRLADVDWIEASGNYVRLHTARGEHVVRDSLAALETRLDPRRFVRIHRGTIVNLDRVKEMQPWFSGDYVLILQNSARLKLSRSYRDAILERMGDPG